MKRGLFELVLWCVGAAFCVVALQSWAATLVLIDEDFETPAYANGTANPAFTNWTWINSGSCKARVGASAAGDGLPGVVGNHGIQLEWTSAMGEYAIDYGWANRDVFSLTVNMAPQEWGGTGDRFLVPSLYQQEGTLLWTTNVQLPYANGFGGLPWAPEITFNFEIAASNFTTGTEEELIKLRIAHPNPNRGVFFDNVLLTVPTPPRGTVITLY